MTQMGGSVFEIRDVVYGFIQLDEQEWDIINHPVYQRLRRIKQLSLTDMAYPGAVHTRLEHSIGVMQMATDIYNSIISKRRARALLSEQYYLDAGGFDRYRKVIRLAALLHDIGHSPFSHTGENLMPLKKASDGKRYEHEEYSIAIIKTYFREIIEEHPINANYKISVEEVTALLGDPTKCAFQGILLLFKGIISGQLDADRADYLLRDSIHTGVNYGLYENMNVIEERIPFNVHFKTPTAPTYMEQLKQMETDGLVSLRGLRKDATIFNEIVIDVNTMYFERNGGYEYAKQFYEEAFHFIEEKFGAENVISAVMHADEINIAATEELGKEVYHYHLHAMVLPVVEKEILWSKRCKDEKLRGTVKEVVHQISHSKKWKSDIPLTDEKGNPLLRKNGKPMFRASYSILQDELFNHMTEQGFKGFQRGEYGSTAEHLTSLQYQIKQDKERLEKLQKRIQHEQIKYEPARNVSKTYNEIDRMGQKTITGKMAISKEDYSELTALAKEGITSRAEISELEQSANYYRQKYFDCANALERMKTKYNELKEKCRPFLQALEHFPEVAKLFTEKVKQLFSFKEAQERAEKEAREKERQERIKARRNKRGMER